MYIPSKNRFTGDSNGFHRISKNRIYFNNVNTRAGRIVKTCSRNNRILNERPIKLIYSTKILSKRIRVCHVFTFL